jgi:hypothetical protein
MNAERRTKIATADMLLDAVLAIIESVKEDEQTAYDALPESIQAGSKGEAMNDGIAEIEECFDELDNARGTLSNLKSTLDVGDDANNTTYRRILRDFGYDGLVAAN